MAVPTSEMAYQMIKASHRMEREVQFERESLMGLGGGLLGQAGLGSRSQQAFMDYRAGQAIRVPPSWRDDPYNLKTPKQTPKTLQQTLQAETDKWLEDVNE